MDEIKRLQDEIEYFAGEEDLHMQMRDTFEKYSVDYNRHQARFGYYFRARVRATRELERKQQGHALLPHG